MGDVSQHFSRWEFKCRCGKCKEKGVDAKLIEALEKVRNNFGRRVTINSGWRCEAHNKAEGGYPSSKHMDGLAADVFVDKIRASEIQRYLDELYPDSHGLGRYNFFTHLDVRERKARW